MSGVTGNIYVGLMEFEQMAFVLHYLRPQDTVFDIGANVGSYTVLASKVVGARTVALEPDPVNFGFLMDNVHMNRMQDRVIAICAAAGRASGTAGFQAGHGATSRVISREKEDRGSSISVEVAALDDIASKTGIIPKLIKIDVEGYENEVVHGASRILSSPGPKVVLMELRGHGTRYGFDEGALHATMLSWGYNAYKYDPAGRALSVMDERRLGDMLYIRDLDEARERILGAPRRDIAHRSI